MKSEEKLDQCYEAVKDQLPFVPKLALILGSGLGDYADHVTVEKVIPYESIEGFPRSTVAGHKGQFVYAKVEGVPTVMMQGRVHYYEGYPSRWSQRELSCRRSDDDHGSDLKFCDITVNRSQYGRSWTALSGYE